MPILSIWTIDDGVIKTETAGRVRTDSVLAPYAWNGMRRITSRWMSCGECGPGFGNGGILCRGRRGRRRCAVLTGWRIFEQLEMAWSDQARRFLSIHTCAHGMIAGVRTEVSAQDWVAALASDGCHC